MADQHPEEWDDRTPPDTFTAMAAAITRIEGRVENSANWSLAAMQSTSRTERAVLSMQRIGWKVPMYASGIGVAAALLALLITLAR